MVVVTGGTGLIGSHLMYYLLKKNQAVTATYRNEKALSNTLFIFKCLGADDGTDAQELFAKITWSKTDLLDIIALGDLLEGASEVYHTAALVSMSRKRKNEVLQNNVEATRNVVNMCIEKGIPKLGYVSSVAAVGRKNNAMATETDMPEGKDLSNAYSRSKYIAEMEVWRGIEEGLNAVIINPGIVLGYGNYSKGSLEIIKTIAEGLKFYPTGGNGFVDARDVARMLIELMNTEKGVNQRYILTSANIKYKELIHKIADSLNVKRPSIKTGILSGYLAWIAGEVTALLTNSSPFITRDIVVTSNSDYYYSNEKVKNFLKSEFTPIEKTVEDACKAYYLWKPTE